MKEEKLGQEPAFPCEVGMENEKMVQGHQNGSNTYIDNGMSKRTHATVWSGIKKFNAYLDYGDSESVKLRDKINSVMPVNGHVVDKKYNKLFFLMSTKYNIMLTNEELREIIDVASEIK